MKPDYTILADFNGRTQVVLYADGTYAKILKDSTSTPLITLSDVLAAIRKTRKLSQIELAEMAGLTQKIVSDFETGETDTGYKNVLKIVSALGLSLVLTPPTKKP